MIWEILFSSFFALIICQIIRHLRNGHSLQDIDILLPGHLRQLGVYEFSLHSYFKVDSYLMCSNVILNSKIIMDNRKVEEALHIIAKRHPLLQAVITEVHNVDDRQYHFAKMSSFKVDYHQSDKLASEPSHWHDVMTKDLLEPINDQDGPLWRCCRLKECIDLETGNVVNCFVFIYHHAIIDGTSRKMLFEEFASILDKLHKNESLPKVTYNLRPSNEILLAEKLRPEWWRPIGLKIVEILLKMGLYSLKSEKIDAYFIKYPVICNVYPDVQPENRAIFTSFNKSETKKLLHACKEHGCSVNGAITAAANMAMAEILQDGWVTKPQWIRSEYAINCRRHIDLNENRNIDYLGVCMVITNLDCYIPPYEAQSFWSVFWKKANDITCDVHQTIRTEEHLKSRRNWQCLSLSQHENILHSLVWEHHGRREGDHLFFISNIGRLDEVLNADSLFTIDKVFSISAEHKEGPLFVITFVTVNGRLCCSFSYCPHVTAKDQAEEFNSKLLKNLTRAFNEG